MADEIDEYERGLIERAHAMRMDSEVGSIVDRTRMLGELANALTQARARAGTPVLRETEREAFDRWLQRNGGGLRSMEVGSVMWNRAREAFRAGWDARRESPISGSPDV